MRNVPFFSFTLAPESLKSRWKSAIAEAIDKGKFVGGELVTEFENSWKMAIGAEHAIGIGNGFDGLVLALKALGVGPGDRVAVPSHTFIATWNAISAVGASPIGVDVDEFGLIDLDELEMSSDIKCVIPVHMHGAMVNMTRLNEWARLKSVLVIEDASQAHFAKSNGGYAGTLSHIGVFSLYPTKNLGALGDAGVIVTNNSELANFIKGFANYGASNEDKYYHDSFGVNSRLDSIQAAALSVNLLESQHWTAQRRLLAQTYLENIKETSVVKFMHPDRDKSVWHHFPILTPVRKSLIEHLHQNGVSTEIHYPNLAGYEYARIMNQESIPFPIGEKIAATILSLPISPWHTIEDITYVSHMVNQFSKSS
jgi:dTDP-3-amino-3,4,6-trideoxy-alpha-D-glucose transaminase